MKEEFEPWREPWEQAATEKDPARVIQLLDRVELLLEEHQLRLKLQSQPQFEKKVA
jgi:hypothetical protein